MGIKQKILGKVLKRDKPSPKRANGDLIVCRCEGVTLDTLRSAIYDLDAQTVNQLKKLTRAGMGSCQGRSCSKLIELILKVEVKAPKAIEPYRSRPPVRGIPIDTLAATASQFEEPRGPVSHTHQQIPAQGGSTDS